MDFKLISADKKLDIMPFVNGLKWKDSIDTLGIEMFFQISDDPYDKNFNFLKEITLGTGLTLIKDDAITQVIVVSEQKNEKTRELTCYDYAFWLNKSTTIKQFNKVNSTKAITELCNEFNIKVEVKELESVITKIYNDTAVSEIIKDIIELNTAENKKKYTMEMNNTTLVIKPYEKIIIDTNYKLSVNNIIKASDFVGNVSLSRSIVDMKNKIVVVSGNEKKQRIVAIAEDSESIKKYGLLQEVEKYDEKTKGNVNNIAVNKLKELNKINEDLSLTILGNEKIRAGRILELNISSYELIGEFLIKECEHELINGNHKCNVVLEKAVE